MSNRNSETTPMDENTIELITNFLNAHRGEDMSGMISSLRACYDNTAYHYTSKGEFDTTMDFADDLYNLIIEIE